MSDSDQEQAPSELYAERDRLDRKLGAELAKYAAVEPRPGLEERVLANLQTEQAKVPSHAWWRWSVAFAVATVVVAALVVAWRSETSRTVVVNHTSPSAPSQHESQTNVAANHDPKQVRRGGRVPKRVTSVRGSPPIVVATDNPKLDQFPSPQPLTEQERILASYVALDPEHAALIAEARTEALLREAEERRKSVEDHDSRQ